MLKRVSGCRIWLPVFAVIVLCSGPGVEGREQEEDGGTVTGILTEKGRHWIEVKVDGEVEGRRYQAMWRGGTPKEGGGYDTGTVALISRLFGGNRVHVVWRFVERPRIVSAEMIVPKERAGRVTGTVLARGDAWIEVKPDAADPPDRFRPHWIGGMPDAGGGLDRAMLLKLSHVRVGDRVKLRWEYEERKRVVEIERLGVQREK